MSIEPVGGLSAAFGRVLARFRRRRGLTPESFALAMGMASGDEVTSMERGEREPASVSRGSAQNAIRQTSLSHSKFASRIS
jgi:hypothetical protein